MTCSNRVSIVRAFAALGLLVLASCTKTLPYRPDGQVQLRANEGLLLVHTDSDTRIDRVSMGRGTWIEQIPTGPSLRVVVAPAGSYRLEDFIVRRSDGGLLWSYDEEPTFAFRVEAGRINYPGEIVVHRTGRYLRARMRNRSAMVLPDVQKQYPLLLGRYPLSYTGFQPDHFYRFYSRLVGDLSTPVETRAIHHALDDI